MPKKNIKATFVHSLPATMPVTEVVKKAKAAGIKISTQHVYNTRLKAKKAASVRRNTPRFAAGRLSVTLAEFEDKTPQLRRLIFECGLEAAEREIARLKAHVERLQLVG